MKRWVLYITVIALLASVNVHANDFGLGVILFRYAAKRDLTDWEALVLGLNGVPIKTPLFATPYFRRLENDIKKRNGEYRLVTDYARIALVYRSHGKNPADIAGYNFIERIKNFTGMRNQGLNAFSWALKALYGQPEETTRPFIDEILSYQMDSGGFAPAVSNGTDPRREDVDLTAMAVTALAPYRDDEKVKNAVDKAVSFLSGVQEPDGGYVNYGKNNPESASQVIIALCSLGIGLNDERFIKNGFGVMDALLNFRLGDGSFTRDAAAGKADPISTRQAALAFTAVKIRKDADARIDNGIPPSYADGWIFN
jgi:hypothetical protein